MNNFRKYKGKAVADDGFTLIELLVVILIIGILAAIAFPLLKAQQKHATIATIKSDVRASVPMMVNMLGGDSAFVTADEFAGAAAITNPNNVILIVSGTATEPIGCIWGSHIFDNDEVVSFHYSTETEQLGEGGCIGTGAGDIDPSEAIVVVGSGPVVDDPSTPEDETAVVVVPDPTAPYIPTANNKYPVCHGDAGNWKLLMLPLSAINGHGGHSSDIIPPIAGKYPGKKWDVSGWADFVANCS